jgi:hypothetical protein
VKANVMSKEKRKSKGKVYRPSLFLRFFALCIMISAPLQALYLWATDLYLSMRSIEGMLLSLLLFLLVCVVCRETYKYAFRTYILVNDDGISVEGSYNGFISWDEVERFGWEGIFKGRTWGIKTTETVNPSGYWIAPFTEKFIPLSHIVGQPPSKRFEMIVAGFGDDLDKFAQTPLGQDLLHYAPQLFEKNKHS